MPRTEVTLSYDEAMAVCLLLASDASLDTAALPDTRAEEARLMIELNPQSDG